MSDVNVKHPGIPDISMTTDIALPFGLKKVQYTIWNFVLAQVPHFGLHSVFTLQSLTILLTADTDSFFDYTEFDENASYGTEYLDLLIPRLPQYEGKNKTRLGVKQGALMASSAAAARQRLNLSRFVPVSVLSFGAIIVSHKLHILEYFIMSMIYVYTYML